MSESLVNTGSDSEATHLQPGERRSQEVGPVFPQNDQGPGSPLDFMEEEEGGFDVRRVIAAIRRYWWLILVTFLLGAGAAAVAWTQLAVSYTASGSLWVDVAGRSSNPGDVSPIRQSRLFETNAYIDLLRSFSVLLPVVQEQNLYLDVDPEHRAFFAGFDLQEDFVPGRYVLTVSESGEAWTLTHSEAGPVGQGAAGDSIGAQVGFLFQPAADALPAGTEIELGVLPPHQAAQILGNQLVTGRDAEGNFIRVSYSGRDPRRISEILNAILEEHIDVAADLKRSRLDETREVLEDQLVYAQDLLADAERALEDFRVRTATLPSDQATPIAPGLEMTRDPVFNNYFNMQTELQSIRRDQSRLATILEQLPDTAVPVESLEVIPAVSDSRELQNVLEELVELRSQLRTLRFRYSDEFPPIQEVLGRIETLSTETIPRILRGILDELRQQEARMVELVDSAASELSEIPARTIEEARLRRQVNTRETLYNDLRSRVENSRLATASSVPDVRILDRAVVPTTPSDDPRLLFAALLLGGGLALGILGALVLDRVDSRLRYPTQVDDELGLTILGSIPRVREGGRNHGQNQAAALEAFRELRIAIGFAFGSAGPITFTISSPSEEEGKTFVSANTAVAFADMGRRTLLIDGDTRRGDSHRVLGLERAPGLTDYLQKRGVGEIIQSTSYPNLDYIGSGTRGSHTPELLASSQMSSFLGTLKRAYDVIIIDSPPLTGGGDALVLSSLTGNLALVLRTGSTQKALAAQKVETLQRFPIRVLGAILNDIDPKGLYGYYSTYLPRYLTDVDVQEGGGEGGRQLVAPAGAKAEED